MATDTIPQSLRFLTDAAHLLIKTAPETSAYLMTQRNSLIFHNDLGQSDIQKQHVCGACGHIMIPGQGSELNIDTNKAIWKKKRGKSDISKSTGKKRIRAVGCRKRVTCEMCSRYTDISIPPPAPISRRRQPKPTKSLTLGATSSNVSAAAAPLQEPMKVSANANSKKRAKSRKQGLQALLQQAQSASKSQNGLGLSLSDFMMK